MKKTKIVATLGLVSDTKETLRKMVQNGMNVARLNFSHGDHEWHGNAIKIIRELSAEMNVPIGILGDLQGPRIRTSVEAPVEMTTGDAIVLSDVFYKERLESKKSDFKTFLLDSPKIVDDIEIGHEILIEDGLMKMVVKEKEEGLLITEVIDGGTVKNRKGVNIPDSQLKISAVTEKDERDLKFLMENEVDFIGLSFVGSGEDVEYLRGKMKEFLGREDNLPHIIVKVERKEAIKNLDDIIDKTDAVMVARGDLGIEIEGTKVAVLQKEIVRKSLQKMKPVIVATQMLDSMIVNPRPTRAEISDVTNAVVDHADAVMLSGESAGGKYPVESVRTMRDIIQHTEASPFDDVTHLLKLDGKDDFKNLVKGAFDLAKNSDCKAIILATASGFTGRMMSHFRCEKPLFVGTNSEKVYNQLTLAWGVQSFFVEETDLSKVLSKMIDYRKSTKQLKDGDKVIVIFGSAKDNSEKMQMVGVKTV
ncbi:MAG: pyruvate kinase [Candidatus Moranbacteria bacterium]|nr:pyruvate kinase [Candidatus Moranbacteria bacterium]